MYQVNYFQSYAYSILVTKR